MALDRWIALCFLVLCLVYGYTAFFTMDASLPPFLRHDPMWPSTFPKLLSIAGVLAALVVLLGLESKPTEGTDESPEVEEEDSAHDAWRQYHFAPALALLGFMVAYALSLHSLGFLASTFLFLVGSAFVLGERSVWPLAPICALACGLIWYLVDQVLGIYLRPLPALFG